MSDTMNFSAFPAKDRLERIAESLAAANAIQCGWVPPDQRTVEQANAATECESVMPQFTIRGRFQASERRYSLWRAFRMLGRQPQYVWQVTGSCVGAAGGSAMMTAMAVEIAIKREPEEFRVPWWLYTYGRSRLLGGLRGQGEGSFGASFARALLDDGIFEIDPVGQPDLPDYRVVHGWLQQTTRVELEWSDGARIAPNWLTLGRRHRFRTVSRLRSADDCFEAIVNGYPITLASAFGMRQMVPGVRGSQHPIRVGEWTGTWYHQMFCDEVWDHPELRGLYFRIGNNWGPSAHGSPTGSEPAGGFYVTAATMDRICRTGEVFALSQFDGFPARDLDFSAF